MHELHVARLPEFVEHEVRVSEWSTVRVKCCAYSVPSRLMGEWVKARVFEDKIEVWYGGKEELSCERLRGDKRHRIDYRHVIWSLVRKPGAFARYVYREELFPSVVFRRAYDAIQTPHRMESRGTWNTFASCTWPRVRSKPTSRPRSPCCSRRGQVDRRRRSQGPGGGEDDDRGPHTSRRRPSTSGPYDGLIGEVGT